MSTSYFFKTFNGGAKYLDKSQGVVIRTGLEIFGLFSPLAFDVSQLINSLAIIYANNVLNKNTQEHVRGTQLTKFYHLTHNLIRESSKGITGLSNEDYTRARFNIAKNLCSALSLWMVSTFPASLITAAIYVVIKIGIYKVCNKLETMSIQSQRNNSVVQKYSGKVAEYLSYEETGFLSPSSTATR